MAQATIATTVTGLQTRPVSNAAPVTGQALVWNGSQWQPDNTTYLQVAGGTMTGPLTLSGAATAANQPVTLSQLQAGYLPISGGIMTGAGNITSPSPALTLPSPVPQYPTLSLATITLPTTYPIHWNAFYDSTGNEIASVAGYAGSIFLDSSGNFHFRTASVTAGATIVWADNIEIGNGVISVQTGTSLTRGSALLTVENVGGLAAQFACGASAAANTMTIRTYNNINTSFITFQWGTTGIGGILNNGGTGVTYSTTSDARLKRDLMPISDAGTLIEQLDPVWFRWISTGRQEAGFSAQDLHKVYPMAVTPGHGDPGDEDFRPWASENSKLMPLVIAELQALRRRVKELEKS